MINNNFVNNESIIIRSKNGFFYSLYLPELGIISIDSICFKMTTEFVIESCHLFFYSLDLPKLTSFSINRYALVSLTSLSFSGRSESTVLYRYV